MAYVPLDKDMLNHPLLLALAGKVAAWLESLPPDEVRDALRDASRTIAHGSLARIWTYADSYISSDNTFPVTLEELAAAVTVPTEILRLWPQKWLQVREDGTVELPGYVQKNNLQGRDLRSAAAAKKRADTAERNRKLRRRKRDARETRHGSVTVASRVTHARRARDATTGTVPVPDLNPTGTVPGPGSAAPPPALPDGAPAPRGNGPKSVSETLAALRQSDPEPAAASPDAEGAIRDLHRKGYPPQRIADFLKTSHHTTLEQVHQVLGVEGNGADAKRRRKR